MRALTLLTVALLTLSPVNALAADMLTDKARGLLVAFTEAVIAGPEATAEMLAPEYQIMRANGVGYDRDGYIETGVGSVSAGPEFAHTDIVATEADGVIVVRYMLEITETIDGAPVERRAPRLTVFRQIDGDWKVVSHANFGATEPQN